MVVVFPDTTTSVVFPDGLMVFRDKSMVFSDRSMVSYGHGYVIRTPRAWVFPDTYSWSMVFPDTGQVYGIPGILMVFPDKYLVFPDESVVFLDECVWFCGQAYGVSGQVVMAYPASERQWCSVVFPVVRDKIPDFPEFL